MQTRKVLSLFFALTFIANGWPTPQLWAQPNFGTIQQIEVLDTPSLTTVAIRGRALGKCQPVFMRDPQGQRPPTLLLPFAGTGVVEKIQGLRDPKGAIQSVQVVPLTSDPAPLTQVMIALAFDLPYKLQRNDTLALVEVQKPAGPSMAGADADDHGLQATKYHREEIQPGDMLYVSVSPAEELSRDLSVDQDGKIFIPIIGAVSAGGMSSDALAKKIQGLLAKYVTNPKVEVLIKQFSAQQISVMGQVRMPGSYPYRPNLRLLDVVSMAAGFVPGANKNQIRIYRGSGASRKVTIVDVQEAIKTGDVTKDFLLQPGDLIDVPKGVSPLTIFGDIPRGGNFEYFKGMRLLDLVALCQGFSESANYKHITIFRGESPNQRVFSVRFDDVMAGDMRANVLLEPGDIIFVPKRSLWTYSALANTIVPFTTILLAATSIMLIAKTHP